MRPNPARVSTKSSGHGLSTFRVRIDLLCRNVNSAGEEMDGFHSLICLVDTLPAHRTGEVRVFPAHTFGLYSQSRECLDSGVDHFMLVPLHLQ